MFNLFSNSGDQKELTFEKVISLFYSPYLLLQSNAINICAEGSFKTHNGCDKHRNNTKIHA